MTRWIARPACRSSRRSRSPRDSFTRLVAVSTTGYRIYRDASLIGTVSGSTTVYADLTLSPSTAYSYTVVALDAAGNTSSTSSSAGDTTAADTPPSPTGTPTTPTDLSGTAVSKGRIDLTWSPSTDPYGVAGYKVYRDGTLITPVPVNSAAYSDTGLTSGVSHTYTVSALDSALNESSQSISWSGSASDGATVTTYAYDAAHNLTGASTAGQPIAGYAYDGDGNRVSKSVGAVSTSYGLDLATSLPQALSVSTGSSVSTYLYAFSGGAGPAEELCGSDAYWPLADAAGSTRVVSDASGTTTSSYSFSAFGGLRDHSGPDLSDPLFTGQLTDRETGFLYLRARLYDPATATFLQRDSYAGQDNSPITQDRYLYAQADPTNRIDPSGRCSGLDILCYGNDIYQRSGGRLVNWVADGMPQPTIRSASGPEDDQNCSWIPTDGNSCYGQGAGSAGDAYSHSLGGVINHPADFLRDSPVHFKFSATVGLCVRVDGSYGFLGGIIGSQASGGACIYASTNGQLAFGVSGSAGLGHGDTGGFHAGSQINLLFSNGGDVYDQEGPFAVIGGEVSDGWGGADLSLGTGRNHCKNGGVINVEGGWAPGFGANISDGISYSPTKILWSSKPATTC